MILRLYPLPAREGSAIYEDLDLPPSSRRWEPSRPYVAINMISSVDGRTTTRGKAGRLGSITDRLTMRTLRSKADAVMIGANTLRAEKLSLGLDEPSGEQPLAVIVTNSGSVPLESNLILDKDQRVVVVSPENLGNRSGSHARVLRRIVPATPAGDVDLAEALAILKSEHAVDVLLVEGGPTLNHALISTGLVDELFLTISPKLVGGTQPNTLTVLQGGELLQTPTLQLISVHHCDGELYLRYRWASTQ